jgi:hypothetical protein
MTETSLKVHNFNKHACVITFNQYLAYKNQYKTMAQSVMNQMWLAARKIGLYTSNLCRDGTEQLLTYTLLLIKRE